MKKIFYIPFFLLLLNQGCVKKEEKSPVDETLFKEILKAFNSNNDKEINKYINPNYGLMISYYDGPFNQLEFSKKFDVYFKYDNDKVFVNLENGLLPTYIGDGEFEKTGSFYEDYSGRFDLDKFNFMPQGGQLTESELKPYRQLEELCNYRLQAISISGKIVYSFYFIINETESYLLGMSYRKVTDNGLVSDDKGNIDINSGKSVREFLLSQSRFCDKENGAYIDFSKNEFDEGFGSGTYKFSSFRIGQVERVSEKIKVRTIEFLYDNSEDSFNGTFKVLLTNKGILNVGQSGARPSYNYTICD